MAKKITLRRLYDMHVHLRGLKTSNPNYYEDNLMAVVAPFTMEYCAYAVIMPNPKPRAILCAKDVVRYQNDIKKVQDAQKKRHSFTPLMTIEVRDDTTPQMISKAKEVGAVAGKVYPLGIYGQGLSDFFGESISQTFKMMQSCRMPLLLHGELDLPRTIVTKREEVFLPVLVRLAKQFPDLKIVLEHVSSKKGVEVVQKLGPNVAATITAHHLCTTLNDVIGRGIKPHNACNPMPKDFPDMDALLEAAISGNPKFFLGSDSAPHLKKNKECACGVCGAFTAPILPQLLSEVFEIRKSIHRLEDFTSTHPAKFYDLPLTDKKITLVEKEWIVPEEIDGVVPFMFGQKLRRQLAA